MNTFYNYPNFVGLADKKNVFFRRDTQPLSMHVLGLQGMGKSYWLMSYLMQEIMWGKGCFLIDPHGTLSVQLFHWFASLPDDIRENRKIVYLEPGHKDFYFGYDPLSGISDDPRVNDFYIEGLVEVLIRAFGYEPDEQPLTKTNLTAIIHALVDNRQNLRAANVFFDPGKIDDRKNYTDHLTNEQVDVVWRYLNSMKQREFNVEMGPPLRRIINFLVSMTLRTTFDEMTLRPFREYMDEGAIVICNLHSGNRVHTQSQSLLARVLINGLHRESFLRKHPERQFSVVIDECHRFLSGDISEMIFELRKFGINMVLSHQNLSQLGAPGTKLRESVVDGCQTKVVFRIGDSDALDYENRLFTHDPDLVKDHRYELQGHTRERLKNGSESNGGSEMNTQGGATQMSNGGSKAQNLVHNRTHNESNSVVEVESSATAFHEGEALGAVQSQILNTNEEGDIVLSAGLGDSTSSVLSSSRSDIYGRARALGRGVSSGVGIARGLSQAVNWATSFTRNWSHSFGKNWSKAAGWSETLIPVLKRVANSYESLENQRYKAAKFLSNLPERQFILKVPGSKNPLHITKTPEIHNFTQREFKRAKDFIDRFLKTSPELRRYDQVISGDSLPLISEEATPSFDIIEYTDLTESVGGDGQWE